jgi:hypothetical protein
LRVSSPAVVLIAALAFQSADASTNVTPEEKAALKAHAAQMLSEMPNAQGVFEIGSGGGIHHIQSGAGCPLFADGYRVSALQVRDAPQAEKGSSVSCVYDAAQQGDQMVISYVRVEDGVTLDSLFEKAKAEVLADAPQAEDVGPELIPRVNHQNPDWANMRSTGFAVPPRKAGGHIEVVTGLVGRWAIELRATTFEGIHSERNGTEKLMFLTAPYTLFMLEAAALHAHATGAAGTAELGSGQSPSK